MIADLALPGEKSSAFLAASSSEWRNASSSDWQPSCGGVRIRAHPFQDGVTDGGTNSLRSSVKSDQGARC